MERRLRTAGLNVPEVLAGDQTQGFLLLTDLGKRQYLDIITEDNREQLYHEAMEALARMQEKASPSGLPDYNRELLRFELSIFSDWFLSRHLGLTLGDSLHGTLEKQYRILVRTALEQPRLFVHRDYHSRNLMYLPKNNPGILDFQDAVHGPLTYDLVSLLRDCYISWPRRDVESWVGDYYHSVIKTGNYSTIALEQYLRWFDLIGVQRHLKAIGIFARLFHRDGKPGYLKDIPRTLDYVVEVSLRYPELSPLYRIIQDLDLARISHQADTTL
ncbi:MAG: phosphotransferase [Gammaproteobacteria bacterium]|nr:phosphotransferase [Gammaproteobacteria bacterium]